MVDLTKRLSIFSKNLPCDPCACFCIGQCMVVIRQIVSAGRRYRLKLVVLQIALEMLLLSCQSVVKDELGVIHPVTSEYLAQAPAVKPGVVSYQGNSCRVISSILGENLNFVQKFSEHPSPYVRKYLRIIGVLMT